MTERTTSTRTIHADLLAAKAFLDDRAAEDGDVYAVIDTRVMSGPSPLGYELRQRARMSTPYDQPYITLVKCIKDEWLLRLPEQVRAAILAVERDRYEAMTGAIVQRYDFNGEQTRAARERNIEQLRSAIQAWELA